jgi:hypothetical protein
MLRRNFLQGISLSAPFILMLEVPAEARLSSGIDELVRELGFTLEIPLIKAVAGSGALLNVARETLSASEFTQISEFMSGVERLIQQADNVIQTPMPKSMGEMPRVMDELGLPAGSTDKFKTFALQYIRGRGGRKIVGLLKRAWQA